MMPSPSSYELQTSNLTDTQRAQATGLRGVLESSEMMRRMKAAAPDAVDPRRLVAVALTTATKTPKLLECSPASMMRSLLHCAELGLEPGGALGHVYLIPYQGEVTVQLGYKGLAELARRSGNIARINAGVVYVDELYGIDGRPPTFDAAHEPPTLFHGLAFGVDRSPANLRLAYCVVETLDGGRYQVVCTSEDIDKAKASAHSPDRPRSPWMTHPEAMWRKTAIKRLLGGGLVPLSTQLARALEVEQVAEVARVVAKVEPLEVGPASMGPSLAQLPEVADE
jgi:recombination protein RecT